MSASRPGRVRPKDKQIWDAATLKRFLEAVRGEPDEGYWLAQVLCGLRPGEAAALLCCDVDLEGRSLYVHGARVWVGHSYQVGPPKTAGSERHVEMPERLAEVLAKVDLSRPDALLFPSRRGGLRDPSGDARRLVRLCDQVGVPRRRPYELRHTCASLMSAAGVPIELAADQLGHANTQMLMTVYRHRVRKVVRTGMDWGGIGG